MMRGHKVACLMLITQPDSRTIRVVSDTGVVFYVPYSVFWNGFDRPAESIVLREAARGSPCAYEVRAFFLFGEIRDAISTGPTGITIARTWSLKTPGEVHLSLHVELDAATELRCLFPGVHACRGLPAEALSFLGEKTSYPASLTIATGGNGVLLYSKSARSAGVAASIGISAAEIEDEPSRLHVEVRFPGVEEPASRIGPRPKEKETPAPSTIKSPGSLERTHQVSLSFASAAEIHLKGAAAVLHSLAESPSAVPAAKVSIDTALLGDAAKGLLASHLLQRGGVVGVRETPSSQWLSSSAGLGLAIALLRLFPADAGARETALRLADFSLRGQLPSGFFYESYDAETGEWCGVKGEPKRELLSLGQSALVAELFLTLAEDLAGVSRPYEKYSLAGERFVELFLDEKARLSMPGNLYAPGARAPVSPAGGLSGLELFFPVARVLARTGHDRHKKALDLLARRFSSLSWDAFQPPGSREGREPDAAGAFLAVRLFTEMRALGYKPAEKPASGSVTARARAEESVRLFASFLVPWIRVHSENRHTPAERVFVGCLADSFVRQRVIFAGNEAAHLLLGLAALTTSSETKSLLAGLARLCLQGAREAPLGTAFFQHTQWDSEGKPGPDQVRQGPVDSRRCSAEILAGLRIAGS
jgi:hypothetical protein